MFAVWFLQLVDVPSPRYDRAGRAFSVPQPHTGFCRSGEASPKDDLKTSKQEGEVRRRTVDRTRHLGVLLCYLGNSQSAIRTVTNGKRGGADQANLNAPRGAQVGAGGEEGVGRAFGWSGALDCGGGTRLQAATAAAENRRRVSSGPQRSLPRGLQRSGALRRSRRKPLLCRTQRCSVETDQVLGGSL